MSYAPTSSHDNVPWDDYINWNYGELGFASSTSDALPPGESSDYVTERETDQDPGTFTELEQSERRIEELLLHFQTYISGAEVPADSESEVGVSEPDFGDIDGQQLSTGDQDSLPDVWSLEEPEDHPVVLGESPLPPENLTSPSNSAGGGSSSASGNTSNIIGHDSNASSSRDADIASGSAVDDQRAPRVLMVVREDDGSERALPTDEDGYANPHAMLRRLSEQFNAIHGRKHLKPKCYDRLFVPKGEKAKFSKTTGKFTCRYRAFITPKGKAEWVPTENACGERLFGLENYGRHIVCSHIVGGRPKVGETLDYRINDRLHRSLLATGEFDAAREVVLDGKGNAAKGTKRAKGKKRKAAEDDESSGNNEESQPGPSKRRRGS